MDDLLSRALARLPHGPEFRFLDRLLSLEPGQRGAAEYKIRGDEPFLAGHFPGRPVFPGVLLVEAVAQLAGVVAQSDPNLPPLPDLRLTALKGAKILGSAMPGEVLRIEARIAARLENLVQAEGVVLVNNRRIVQAELTLSGGKGLQPPIDT